MSDHGDNIHKKLIIIGDGATGKTCFLHRFKNKEFLESHIPTVFENQSMSYTVDGQTVELRKVSMISYI